MTPAAALGLAVLLLAGCADGAAPGAPGTAPPATTDAPPVVTPAARPSVLCSFADRRIAESSGLAVQDQRVWTHNDSGDEPRLYGLDRRCRTTAVLTLAGTDARDWEDLAATPGTLWAADIGDNRAARTRGVLVHRVAVPSGSGPQSVTPTSYRLRYEDGPRDAEALLVHPRTGQVLVVEKSLLGAAGVYAAPQPFAAGQLRRVGELGVGAVTGGSVSPRGDRVVLRTYTSAFEWVVTGDDLVGALAGEPERVALPASQQGEGIAYDTDGRSWLLSSEGERAPVVRVGR